MGDQLKAIELSGLHVDKLIHLLFVSRNKDGSARKNAVPRDWWVHVRGVTHAFDGKVSFGNSSKWYMKKPPARNNTAVPYGYGYAYGDTHPGAVSYDQDVEIVE